MICNSLPFHSRSLQRALAHQIFQLNCYKQHCAIRNFIVKISTARKWECMWNSTVNKWNLHSVSDIDYARGCRDFVWSCFTALCIHMLRGRDTIVSRCGVRPRIYWQRAFVPTIATQTIFSPDVCEFIHTLVLKSRAPALLYVCNYAEAQ